MTLIRTAVRVLRNLYKPNWPSIRGIKNLKNQSNKSGAHVLIGTVGGGYAAAKQVESLIAAALKIRGARVSVLLCDGALPACFQTTLDWDRDEKKFSEIGTSNIQCKSCWLGGKLAFESVGASVYKLSDFIKKVDFDKINYILTNHSFLEYQEFKLNGVSLGEHAMAGALRFYARGNLQDKYDKEIFLRYFKSALLTYFACERIIEQENIQHFVCHHGIYVPQGILLETFHQHGIPVSSWHVAYRKQCLIFSHNATYHKTLLSEPNEDWQNIKLTASQKIQLHQYLQSRWLGKNDQISFTKPLSVKKYINNHDLVTDDKPNILLLTNVIWDAQLHYEGRVFDSMMSWVLFTLKFFIKNQNLNLIIRIHPAERFGTLPSRQNVADEIARTFPNLPANITILAPDNPTSTYELAEISDSVLIYGTKTGVELAARGIPVIVAGEAWIRNKGIAIDIKSKEHYLKVLKSLPVGKVLSKAKTELAEKYAYHFFFRRMIFVKSLKNIKSHAPLAYNFGDISEIEESKDKGLDVICNGILKGSKFIFDKKYS